MHAPLADFVSALIAEEVCSVCSETYAAVDQRICRDCGAVLCPECARLRPDTQWTCGPCERRAPARIFSLSLLATPKSRVSLGNSRALRLIGLHFVLRALVGGAALVQRGVARCWSLLVSLVLTFGKRLHSAGSLTVTRFQARLWPRLRTHIGKVYTSWQRDREAVFAALRELVDSGVQSARLWLSERVLAIRNISVREQVAAVLLAGAILIAVARSQRHNTR